MQKLLLAAVPLLASSLLAQGVAEATEPNNTTSTATVLPTGAQGYGDIAAGDEDWFKITLTAPRDLKVWSGPGFGSQIGDTKVRIYAADGTTLLIDMDDGNTTTHGFYSTFSVGNYAPGDYYVTVRGYDALTVGTYTLDVVAAAPGTYAPPAPVFAPATEGPENNDPRPGYGSGTATVTVMPSRSLGNNATAVGGTSFVGVGDYDFYRIVVPAAGTLTASTSVLTGGVPSAPAPAMLDTVVHLADAAFARLAFHDDVSYPSNALSILSYAITTPGTYYVVVSGYDTGNYLLDISLSTPLPTGPSTVTIQTGGCVGSAGTPALGNRLSTTGTNVRPERPVLGSHFYLDGTNLPANAPLLRVIGFVTLPAPLSLLPYGAPLCQVEVSPIDQSFATADAAGVAFWGLGSPSDVSFIGLPVQQQLAVLDPAANALGLTMSNRVSSVFGITH